MQILGDVKGCGGRVIIIRGIAEESFSELTHISDFKDLLDKKQS